MDFFRKFFMFSLAFSLAASGGDTNFFRSGEEMVIPCGEKEQTHTVEFTAPKCSAEDRAVLRFEAFLKGGSGWNSALQIKVNGKWLTEEMASGEKRLLRRGDAMMNTTKGSPRRWWSGRKLLVFFGDGKKLDERVTSSREEGFRYQLDITDLVNTGKNSLEIINSWPAKGSDGKAALHLRDISIGFVQETDANAMRPGKSAASVAAPKPYWENSEFIPIMKWKGTELDSAASLPTYSIKFNAVPKKDGHGVVLGFRGYLDVGSKGGGWNYHLGMMLNGVKLDKKTREGEFRLLRRGAFMDTTLENDPQRDWWKSGLLCLFFGDGKQTDRRIRNAGEEGYNFLLDISDAVNYFERGVDNRVEKDSPNEFSISSTYTRKGRKGALGGSNTKIEEIVVGYVPLASLEKMRPQEHEPETAVKKGTKLFSLERKEYALDFYRNGGFVIRTDKREYCVQDAFSYPAKPEMEFSRLVTEDSGTVPSVRKDGGTIVVETRNPVFSIRRTVTPEDNYFLVKDEITNRTDRDQGMKVRFVTSTDVNMPYTTSFVNGMNEQFTEEGAGGQNPTFHVKPAEGGSLGIYVYDDLLRNQSSFLRTKRDFILEDEHIGFPAKSTRTLVRRFYPKHNGGFFDFVNQVRRDLNLNWTLQGPFGFGGYREVPGGRGIPKLNIRAGGSWFEWNANSKFISREDYKEKMLKMREALKKHDPGAKLLGRLESNIVNLDRTKIPNGMALPEGRRGKGGGVYGLTLTPEQNEILKNSPFADSIMRNEKGMAIVDTNYAEAPELNLLVHFAEGNYRLKNILEQIDFLLDNVGLDGVYVDQFVPGCDQKLHNNKRCSYDKWDNYSIDLKPDGTISRKFYDYILAGSSARAEIVKHVTGKGKVFYNNTHPVTLETNGLPAHSFGEMTGNPVAFDIMGRSKPGIYRVETLAQLSGSPMTLGITPAQLSKDMSQYPRFYNRAVILALRHGLLYAYYHSTFPEQGGGSGPTDHMYPATPEELGEGFILCKERILTCISKKFFVRTERKPVLKQFDENGVEKNVPESSVVKDGNGWSIDVKLDDWNEVAVILK